MDLPQLSDRPLLICRECGENYSAIDLAIGVLDFRTMTCHYCFQEMSRSKIAYSCFGKVGGRGYDEESPECQVYCEDRVACREWKTMANRIELTEERRKAALEILRSQNKPQLRGRKQVRNEVFQKGSIIRVIFDLALKGTTVKELRRVCSSIGADPSYYLRKLRGGFANGFAWKTEEANGEIVIRYLRRCK